MEENGGGSPRFYLRMGGVSRIELYKIHTLRTGKRIICVFVFRFAGALLRCPLLM
jgi:hypothetical protein